MSDLVRIVIDDVVYMLGVPPFNYIVGAFLLSITIFAIFYILKGGER